MKRLCLSVQSNTVRYLELVPHVTWTFFKRILVWLAHTLPPKLLNNVELKAFRALTAVKHPT